MSACSRVACVLCAVLGEFKFLRNMNMNKCKTESTSYYVHMQNFIHRDL